MPERADGRRPARARRRVSACLVIAAVAAAAGCWTSPPDAARERFLATVAGEEGAWHVAGRWTSPCLRADHVIVEWVGPSGRRLFAIRVEGESHEIADPDDLRPYIVPIDSRALAVEYSDVLRLFEFPEARVPGALLRDDAAIDWESPPGREAARVDVLSHTGSFEVVRTVRLRTPSRKLRRVRESIGPDGRYAWEFVPDVTER